MSNPRKIEYLPLSELRADPRNPKAHDLETIDQSIGRFGVLDPIVRDGRTGFIISGHGRRKALEAMLERGETPPEGVKVTAEGSWLVPVATGWASRTDSEASAALIALNRTTELGGWVDDSLLDLLDDLRDIDDGLLGVGFTEEDMDSLAYLTDTLETSGPRDLDDLAEEYGEPTEEDKLITVSLRLPEVEAEQFSALVGNDPQTQVEQVRQWLGQ